MATGARLTGTDTTPIMRAIADTIANIDPAEAPLLNLLGLNNESKFRLVNWPNTKVEWLEDNLAPRSGTIAEDLDNSETGVDLTTGQGDYLKKGDVLIIDSELMLVASVSTDTATVTRGFAGSTAATHSNGATWKLATHARTENDSYTRGYTTTLSAPYNYVQQLSEAIEVSNDEQVNPKYGITDTLAYHLSKIIGGGMVGGKNRAGKLPILLEQTFFYGKRLIRTGTTVPAMMGGFNQYVSTNVTNLSSAALTQKHIEDKMQACFDYGGSPNTIICGSWARRKISSFFQGSIQTTRTETTGGSSIDVIHTDFGDMTVVHNRWCPTDELYIIDPDLMGWVTFRPFDVVDMPVTTDGIVKDVRGSFSFVLVNEKAHARLYGISTTN